MSLRHVALVSAFAVVACKPSDVPQGRYACDPTQDRAVGAAQCPGDSRCGLEGYCHDVGDTSVRWKCASADDCEAGWQCGVASDGDSRECHDPAATEPYRCLTSADCSSQWTCGLDSTRFRRCHDPKKPEAWPCESTADCVAGWQCGLSSNGGRECHDPAAPQAWPCATDVDCLGGFKCGLNDTRTGRECHDPAAPRAFACEVASDCLGGFSCGLNDARTGRECHDPNRPRAFSCEVPSDCLASWTCGLNDARTARVCHDPNNPREFACLVTADCVANWRCGLASNRLQRECHDPNAPRAFACERDDDCLAGWRCANDGFCVNPIGDALAPIPGRDGGPAETVSPLDSTPISRASVSPLFRTPDGRDVTVVALIRGGRLEAFAREAGGFRRWTTNLVTEGPVLSSGSRWIRNLSSFPFQQRVNAPLVYVVGSDGGVLGVELLPDGGVSTLPIQDPTDVQVPRLTSLRYGTSLEFTDGGAPTGADMPYMLGFSRDTSAEYTLFDGPERSITRTIYTFMGLPDIARTGNVIFDMANVYFPRPGPSGSTYDLECTFLVDSAGLWVMADDSRFEPLHSAEFGNSACGATGQRVERFSTIDARRAVVVSSPWDGGAPRSVSAWDLSAFMPVAGQNPTGYWCQHDWTVSMNMCRPLDRGMPSRLVGPCVACPAGELLDVSAVDGPTLELETRCAAPDAGTFAFFRHAPRVGQPGQCVTRLIANTSSLFAQRALSSTDQPTPGRIAYTSPDGRVWTGNNALTATSLHFDVQAKGVLQLGSSQRLVIGDGVVGSFVPNFGIAGVSRATPTAVGLNQPAWAIVDNQVVSFSRTNSLDTPVPLAITGATLPAGQVLVRARAPTNEVVAVVAAGNQVWTAVVNDSATPPPPSLLVPRVTTMGTISSLAVSPTPDAGTLFTGYVTTPFGVNQLSATSPTSWRSEFVPLPQSLTAHEVWFANGRGRVGFTTGEVYALPSRVPLATALPEPVEDYAELCGRQFALTRSSLYELEPVAGSPIGTWQQVLSSAAAYGDGKLHGVGSTLYLFSRAGEVSQLDVSPCP